MFLVVDSLQVYDVVLDAALHTQKCGPRNLLVTEEWEWLLNGFAGDWLAAGMLCKQPTNHHPQLQSAALFLKQVPHCLCLQHITFMDHMHMWLQDIHSDDSCLVDFSNSLVVCCTLGLMCCPVLWLVSLFY